MTENKKVLLIAGGGTLGTYTAKELLRLGCNVDVICPEEKISDNGNLRFFREYATLEFLEKHFERNKYDGIVNFLHYKNVEDYKPFHRLLSQNTGHLIFLSSYRVYADLQHPITENAPLLADVIKNDETFLKTEDYALPKIACERFIRNESKTGNWTIVRPVISTSDRRFDLVTLSGHEIPDAAAEGKTLLLPETARNLTASVDWAGNVGKLIANLLFKKDALCHTYTVSSAQNLTWGEVADIYERLLGVKFIWTTVEEYVKTGHGGYGLTYDRLYDRKIDNSEILKVTGLKSSDFTALEDGIKIELEKIRVQK